MWKKTNLGHECYDLIIFCFLSTVDSSIERHLMGRIHVRLQRTKSREPGGGWVEQFWALKVHSYLFGHIYLFKHSTTLAKVPSSPRWMCNGWQPFTKSHICTLRSVSLTHSAVFLFGDKILFIKISVSHCKSQMCNRSNRRTVKNLQLHIFSLMLLWIYPDMGEKTKIGHITLKDTSLLRVWMCFLSVHPPMSWLICCWFAGVAFSSHAMMSVCSWWWTANLWCWD